MGHQHASMVFGLHIGETLLEAFVPFAGEALGVGAL